MAGEIVDFTLERLVRRASQLVYARCIEEEMRIALRFTTEKELVFAQFKTTEACDTLWQSFSRTMREHPTSPCLQVGSDMLFQPAYLLNIVRYTKDDWHYVILDFGEYKSFWLGNKEPARQILLYETLLQALGVADP